jgi:hypothetical protein
MKKLFLLTAGLLVLAAPVAMADGMNLAWATCRTAANTGTASTNEFTLANPADCLDPANDFIVKRLTCSFKNSTPLTQFFGTTVRIDILSGDEAVPASPVLSDWWRLDPSGCRAGGLSAPQTAVAGANCTNPYTLTPTDPAGQSNFENISVSANGKRLRYEADHVRNTLAVDLPVPVSAGGYLANNVALSSDVSGTCNGCEQPVSIALNALVYAGSQTRDVTTYELNGCVTYTGGAAGGCPGAVPTRNVTWGHVKQLYR